MPLRRPLLLLALLLTAWAAVYALRATAADDDHTLYLPVVRRDAERPRSDRPDDQPGYQIKIVYALPRDGIDRRFDLRGDLATSTYAYLAWLAAQTGGATLRLDTYQGVPDILFVVLPRSDAQYRAIDPFIRTEIEHDMRQMGLLSDPQKIYAVYYDGSSDWSCGGGAWPPELFGQVAALYLKGLPDYPFPCDSNTFAQDVNDMGYFEFAMLHEIMHTLGYVAPCGRNHYRRGHTFDSPSDLMWAGDAPWQLESAQLDINNDDYFRHNIPDCPDLEDSIFLTPLPANPVAPPGW